MAGGSFRAAEQVEAKRLGAIECDSSIIKKFCYSSSPLGFNRIEGEQAVKPFWIRIMHG